MEKILECLTDPSWWFTVVFVAFLMSLFAGMLIKPLLRLIATRSNYVRTRLAEKDRRMDEQADEIMKDPTRIIVAYLLLIFWVCLSCGVLGVGYAAVLLSMVARGPGYGGLVIFSVSAGYFLWIQFSETLPRIFLTTRISSRLSARTGNAEGKNTPTQREAPTQPKAK